MLAHSVSNVTHPDNTSSDSKRCHPQQLNQQLGFLAPLGSDIILTIFLCLDQEDCLECMAVCSSWYKTIPQYAKSTWRTITFKAHDTYRENMRRTCCLGSHTKSVNFDGFENENELYYLMQKVIDWGCIKVEMLEFNECATVDHDSFLAILTRISPCLTQLTLKKHNSNVSFLHLFSACPMLTAFTFSSSQHLRSNQLTMLQQEPTVTTSLPVTSMHTNIQYLCLDVPLRNVRLKSIFKSCPNLLYFIGSRWDRSLANNPSAPFEHYNTDLDSLFDWCPNITHLQNSCSYFYTEPKLEYSDLDKNCDGLRYLRQCEEAGLESIARLLNKKRSTLEHLSLRKNFVHMFSRWNWSPVFQSLQLPQLRILDCGTGIKFDLPSLVTLLNHSPAIETIKWEFLPFLTFKQSIIQPLRILPQLRSLECSYFDICEDMTLMTLLERFPALESLQISNAVIPVLFTETVQCLQQLKQLKLYYITWTDTRDNQDEQSVAQFFQYILSHSSLDTIKLHGLSMIGYKVLRIIGSVRSLKVCEVTLDRNLSSVENKKDDLRDFFTLLKETAIEKLFLSEHFFQLSYEELNILGDLPFLKQLRIFPQNLDDSYTCLDGLGLLQMLIKSTSLTDIYFGKFIKIKGSQQVPDFDALAGIVNQELPYEIRSQTTYSYSSGDEELEECICNPIIKRINKQ